MSVLVDFARALGQIGDPRFTRVILKGLGLTVLGLAAVFWAVMALVSWLLPETVVLPWIGPVGFVDALVSWAAVAAMLVLSAVLMVPVAALVVGFFLDDIAAAVEARHYARLPQVEALPLAVQVRDGLRFLGVVVAANAPAGGGGRFRVTGSRGRGCRPARVMARASSFERHGRRPTGGWAPKRPPVGGGRALPVLAHGRG